MEQQTPKFENPRHKVLAELSKAHDERIAAESHPVDGMEPSEFEPAPTKEPQKAEAPESPAGADKASEELGAGSPDEPQGSQPRADNGQFASKQAETVKVKIDGEELEVPKSEVDAAGSIALYQIEKTSAKRLQQMNQAKAELAAERAELARLIAAQKAQPQQQQQPQAPEPNQDEALISKVNALRIGSDEEALAAARELFKPATIPTDQINSLVARQVEIQTNWKRVNDAEDAFVTRMKDVLFESDGKTLNPLVHSFSKERAALMRQAIVQTGQFPPDPDQFYKDMESEIRTRLGKPAITADLKARVEAKANLAEPKAAAGRMPAPQEKKPLTVAEQIDQQRKARGKPALYH